jgi:hypothetical protein
MEFFNQGGAGAAGANTGEVIRKGLDRSAHTGICIFQQVFNFISAHCLPPKNIYSARIP